MTYCALLFEVKIHGEKNIKKHRTDELVILNPVHVSTCMILLERGVLHFDKFSLLPNGN